MSKNNEIITFSHIAFSMVKNSPREVKKQKLYPVTQFHQVCHPQHKYEGYVQNLGVSKTLIIFQIIVSDQLNQEDNDNEENGYKVKIFKIIGRSLLDSNCISFSGIFLLFALV